MRRWLGDGGHDDRALFEDVFRSIFVFVQDRTKALTSYTSIFTPRAGLYQAQRTTRHGAATHRAPPTLPPIDARKTRAAVTTRSVDVPPPTTYRRMFPGATVTGPPERKKRPVGAAPLTQLGYGFPATAYQDAVRWASAAVLPPPPEVVRPKAASASVGFRVVGETSTY